jgi:hypothetical protein
MDRMEDSGSSDLGSNPGRVTDKLHKTPLSITDSGVFDFCYCNITETIWLFALIEF